MFNLFKLSNKKTIILAFVSLLFVCLQGIFEGLQTHMLANVLNVLKNDVSLNLYSYWFNSAMLFINAICSLVCGIFGSWLGTKSSLLSAEAIRHHMFLKASTLSFAEIDRVSTSSILTRITNDVQKYQLALQLILALFIRSPIMFVYGITTSFIKDWMFGLIFLSIITLIIFIFIVIGQKIMPAFEQVQVEIDNVNVVVRENVLGIKIIKSFGLEEQQTKRFDIYNEKLKKQNTRAWVGFGLIQPLINCSIYISTGIIFLSAGKMFINNRWGKGSHVEIIYELVNLLMMTLTSIIISCSVIINYVRAIPSCKRINDFLNIESSIKNVENPKKLNPNNLDIEFKNVNFKYFDDAQEYVLKNINLKIKQGEMLGIVGPTGAGKTSLINLISRLYDFKEAENSFLKIGGIPIKQIDLESLQDNIGVVLQEKILFSGTIKYNLLYGNPKATDNELMYYANIACADTIINNTEGKLDGVVEQRGKNFSGGQQQRLSITRTLVKKPNILILDDSTSALDMLTEAKLQANIRNKLKITTIIVAQRISSVKDCDHIIVMDHGEIVGYGSHGQLIKENSIYRSIVISQMGKRGLNK